MRRSLPGAIALSVTTAVVLAIAAPGTAATTASTTAANAASAHRSTNAVAALRVLEHGVVTQINDGDTIQVRLTDSPKPSDGCGTPDKGSCRVRFAGVQAPETAKPGRPRSQCGATNAAALVARVLPIGTKVELRAQHSTSRSQGRLLRAVFAQDSRGDYTVDVSQAVLRAGLGLWWADERETANRLSNRLAMEHARAGGQGLWNPGLCRPESSPGAALRVVVIWDALAVDGRRLNGERVLIYNDGPRPVSLNGWELRDSGPHNFPFPKYAVVPANGRLDVAVGKGRDTARVIHMGWTHPRYPNPTGNDMLGDGAYLLDRATNIRAAFVYPCPWQTCPDPARGALSISRVSYDPPGRDTARKEYLVLRNSSSQRITLGGYYVRKNGIQLPFRPGASIAANSTAKVTFAKGKDTARVKFLQRGRTMLGRSGSLQIATPQSEVIACKAWGRARC